MAIDFTVADAALARFLDHAETSAYLDRKTEEALGRSSPFETRDDDEQWWQARSIAAAHLLAEMITLLSPKAD
jgi:hypothetical protein